MATILCDVCGTPTQQVWEVPVEQDGVLNFLLVGRSCMEQLRAQGWDTAQRLTDTEIEQHMRNRPQATLRRAVATVGVSVADRASVYLPTRPQAQRASDRLPRVDPILGAHLAVTKRRDPLGWWVDGNDAFVERGGRMTGAGSVAWLIWVRVPDSAVRVYDDYGEFRGLPGMANFGVTMQRVEPERGWPSSPSYGDATMPGAWYAQISEEGWLNDAIDVAHMLVGRVNGHTASRTASVTVRDYEGEVGNAQHITRNEQGMLPTWMLAKMPGVKGEVPGEHRNKQGTQWDAFKHDVATNGIREPIFITVDHNDVPKISEGNHRRDAAVELGHVEVPVEIRYFGHAEQQGTVAERAARRPTASIASDRVFARARDINTPDAFKTLADVVLGYDEIGSVNDALDLSTVRMPDVRNAFNKAYDLTQRWLVEKGFAEEFVVYRAGDLRGVVSVSYKPVDLYTGQQSYMVKRSDVLIATDAVIWRSSFDEFELQVEGKKLRRVPTAKIAMPWTLGPVDSDRCTQSVLMQFGIFDQVPKNGLGVVDALRAHGWSANYLDLGQRPGPTVKEFCDAHPTGKYYIATSGHAMALIDGLLVDSAGRGMDNRRRLIGAYEVTRRPVASIIGGS